MTEVKATFGAISSKLQCGPSRASRVTECGVRFADKARARLSTSSTGALDATLPPAGEVSTVHVPDVRYVRMIQDTGFHWVVMRSI